MTIKIHVSRDFSFAEFETDFDPETGKGLPSNEDLCRIFDMLPSKDTQPISPGGGRLSPEDAKWNAKIKEQQQRRADQHAKLDPPATANQRRVLERYGEWREGMTKSEASKILNDMGF